MSSIPPPTRRTVSIPRWALTAMIAAIAVLLLGLLIAVQNSQASAHTSSSAVKTVTVASDTGVSQDQFNACATAYQQVVTMLGTQSDILTSVSNDASDILNAAQSGDLSSLNAATDDVNTQTSREQGLSGDMGNVDTTACQQ